MAPVTLLVVGAGERGSGYARYALEHPDRLKVVSVAEPREAQRNRLVTAHGIEDASMIFNDWADAAADSRGRIADAVVIATLDAMHRAPAEAFAKLGYHMLLEKPMAATEEDCLAIATAIRRAREANPALVFAVGHVLRYSPYSTMVRRILARGELGDIVNVQHLEPVGHFHYAHSYVRGNWARQAESSFFLSAKGCHDIDLIPWYLGARVARVQSFGALTHFRPERKPEGAADRCLDCKVADDCPYAAQRVYIEPAKAGKFGWPVRVVCPEESVDALTRALETGPYGKCVYGSDNDQPDNQVVSMQFEGLGATATLSFVSSTELLCERQTKVFGSRAELSGDMETIRVYDYVAKTAKIYKPNEDPDLAAPEGTQMSGHGGADYHCMKAFVAACAANDPSLVLSGLEETLDSHLVTFAAERARLENRVVEIAEVSRELAAAASSK